MIKYFPMIFIIQALFAYEVDGAFQKKLDSFEVRVSVEDGSTISEIVSTLGELSLISLGFKKSHLKELGSHLKGVGPLNFLGYIFSNDELKKDMKTIRQSSIKWKGFLEGIKPGLDREVKEESFQKEIEAFAKLFKVDPELLLSQASKKDWDRFVAILVENVDSK